MPSEREVAGCRKPIHTTSHRIRSNEDIESINRNKTPYKSTSTNQISESYKLSEVAIESSIENDELNKKLKVILNAPRREAILKKINEVYEIVKSDITEVESSCANESKKVVSDNTENFVNADLYEIKTIENVDLKETDNVDLNGTDNVNLNENDKADLSKNNNEICYENNLKIDFEEKRGNTGNKNEIKSPHGSERKNFELENCVEKNDEIMLFDKNGNKNFEENIEEINNENYDKYEIKELFMIGNLLEKDLREEVAFFENFDDPELSFVYERIIHINDSYEVNANNNCDYDKIGENERFDKLLKALGVEYNQSKELNNIIDLIREYADIFHLKGETLGATHIIEHAIHTKDAAPINARPYRFPAALREELHRQVNEMLETGIVETSESPYRSNIFLVPKPPDKEGNKRYRLVVDFRQLNEKTIPDRYPLPNILDIIDQVGGSKYFFSM
uniref:Reverse transcriptase domain-containing protein n=1 Tax=Trichogramma kaykai TaxID=54128 RepID=A0ABD2WRF9_9HYME